MENFEEEFNNFKQMKKSAFILGFTGESGKALVNELVNSKLFEKVILIGRREVKYPEEEKYNILEQRVIDFDNVSTHQADFVGCDVGFCCLGTTLGTGKANFYKVDHDYIINSAKAAKEAGCRHFHLVSGAMVNAASSFFILRVKGEVENELKSVGFDRVSIYRPAMMMCDRTESRPHEKLMRVLLKPVQWAAPTAMTIPITTLAKGMTRNCVVRTEEKVEMIDNRTIFVLAGEVKEKSQDKSKGKSKEKSEGKGETAQKEKTEVKENNQAEGAAAEEPLAES